MNKLKIEKLSDEWGYIPQEIVTEATHGIDCNIFIDENEQGKDVLTVSVASCIYNKAQEHMESKENWHKVAEIDISIIADLARLLESHMQYTDGITEAYKSDPDCWEKEAIEKYEKLLSDSKEILKNIL